MIRYLQGSGMNAQHALVHSMFTDRATQFRDRMKWDVTVDRMGWETDQYDALDPVYIVAQDKDGRHAGSMRLLPTTGRTMLDEVFPHLTGGRTFRSPRIWECTRFCLAPGAGAEPARLLLIGALEMGLAVGSTHSVGVFDKPMIRIYRRLGWEPEVLGTRDGISAGIWELRHDTLAQLCEAANLHPRIPKRWREMASLNVPVALPLGA